MKCMSVWFLLSCKRYLKKVSFLLILLVLPAAAFLVRRLEREEGQEVRIAVCVEDGEESKTKDYPLETELVEILTEEEQNEGEGLFRFYKCGGEEEVKDQVASRQAECGYVISRDLRRKLDRGDYRRCIRVYSAPSTVLSSLSTEVVFASLMKLYGREIFLDYVMETEVLRGIEIPEETVKGPEALMNTTEGFDFETLAGELYDKWMNNGSTFRFEYHYGNGTGTNKDGGRENVRIFPVRGIVAVYLFLTGLYSAVMLGSDEKKGMFVPLPPGKRGVCRLAVLAAPVFLGAVSAFGALATGGCLQGVVREVLVMIFYGAAVCVFSYGVKILGRKPQVVCCLIPLFFVGSLLFTPVLVDIRQFFPALGWIEKLFLPSYYLRAF